MSDKYNPWSVVNLVFHHLVEQGLNPVLGETGDPAEPAAQLLRALGVEPGTDGTGREQVRQELSEVRAAFEQS